MPDSTGTQSSTCSNQRGVIVSSWGTVVLAFASCLAARSPSACDSVVGVPVAIVFSLVRGSSASMGDPEVVPGVCSEVSTQRGVSRLLLSVFGGFDSTWQSADLLEKGSADRLSLPPNVESRHCWPTDRHGTREGGELRGAVVRARANEGPALVSVNRADRR